MTEIGNPPDPPPLPGRPPKQGPVPADKKPQPVPPPKGDRDPRTKYEDWLREQGR